MLKKSPDDAASADAEARGKDIRALEKVFERLGFDAKQPEDWDRVRELAAGYLGLCRTVGRPKDTKKWDFDRLIVLGANLYQVECKYPNASNEEKALQIKRRWPDDYKHENPSSLRKRLPQARRTLDMLMQDPVIETWSSRFLRGIFPPELLNHDSMRPFLEQWPNSAEWIGLIIKASAEVRRTQERQRRKQRRA
jgi:hypothetical protein